MEVHRHQKKCRSIQNTIQQTTFEKKEEQEEEERQQVQGVRVLDVSFK